MSDWSTFFSSFLGFLFAFITKDFYDFFLQRRIKKFFNTYRVVIEKHIGNGDGSEDDV